eukprot:CAMPEP_0202446826 /NCGR_PEP_ID=MMETSP1360-20130828/5397_1 /ASSEMBLY_ACC=CAM_ASM_000848 /TAXON_ID=515479 /ORGANISM="Licmophora paradoxa, Strain CCMP2313" /LENGTH=391 /DNA_ID=CAMNT_0049063533 /DNA_START=60 /DNA_END=1235 /DNA_ORIENTATION=+
MQQMYETTVLAITSTMGMPLESTPYWWCFSDTDQSEILSDKYYGTYPGLGDRFEIIDGPFANWSIPLYNESYDDFIAYVHNDSDSAYRGSDYGYLRDQTCSLTDPVMVAYPSNSTDPSYTNYAPTVDLLSQCMQCEYDSEKYNIFHFSWCVAHQFHIFLHTNLGGWIKYGDGEYEYGDFALLHSNVAPIFQPYHNTINMFFYEWISWYPEHANTTWGYPNERPYNYFFGSSYNGIGGNDVINSAFPIRWMDVGWVTPDSSDANRTVTHYEAHCRLSKENSDYVYVRFSGAPPDAPGYDIGDLMNMTSTATNETTNDTETNEAETHAESALVGQLESDIAGNQASEASSGTKYLEAAQAFLDAYVSGEDNRIEASNAFLETFRESDGDLGRR